MNEPVTVCIGMFILWWGWIGFNAGSSYGVTGGKWEFAARAGAGTTLASMSAGMTSILLSLARNNGKIDVLEVLCGILSGLG
jgi:ammonium transporter, Amt family